VNPLAWQQPRPQPLIWRATLEKPEEGRLWKEDRLFNNNLKN